MRTTYDSIRKLGARLAKSSVAAAALAVTMFVALPSPARADFPPSPRDVHNRVQRHVRHLLDIPRRLHASVRADFRSHFGGRVYYRAHRHYHTVYRYPVYVGSRVIYRPYSYCNDALFVTPRMPLPRVVVYDSAPYRYYQPNDYDRFERDYRDRYPRDHDRYDRDRDRDRDHGRDNDRNDDRDHDRYDDDNDH